MAEGEIVFRESGCIGFTAANAVASDDTSVLRLTASVEFKVQHGPRRAEVKASAGGSGGNTIAAHWGL